MSRPQSPTAFLSTLYGIKYDLKVANAMLATTSHFTKSESLQILAE